MKPIDNFFREKEQEFVPGFEQQPALWRAFNAALALEAFYTRLAKPVQEFAIRTDRDEVIVGKEGTRLRIPAGCFEGATGNVHIKLQEFYAYADMIAGRLSMRSNERQLVSGGMLYLTKIGRAHV